MFSIGETVKYGVNGICKIVDISKRSFCGEDTEYYVLQPLLRGDSTFFVPTANEALVSKIHHLMSKSAVYELIGEIPECHTEWIDNDKERNASYNLMLTSCDRHDIIGLIRTLHQRKEQLEEKNKKLHQADERILKDAEKIINDEFAVVLDMQPSDVPGFIADKLACC